MTEVSQNNEPLAQSLEQYQKMTESFFRSYTDRSPNESATP
jgi:hypothetical protein